MALTDNAALLFVESGDLIRTNGDRDYRWLSIGVVDFLASPALLRRHGLALPQRLDDPDEEGEGRRRRLVEAFAAAFGYATYTELDLDPRADLKLDLNHPVPAELRGQFDLVWDVGTVEHAMDVVQALRNALDVVRVGGLFVSNQGIGDQTNQGYWTISPNLYLDFLAANEAEVLAFVLWDRRGHRVGYTERFGISPVGSLIPLRLLPGYHLRNLRYELVTRALASSELPGRALASLAYRAPRARRVVDALLGLAPTGGGDWGLWLVARKLAEGTGGLEIQNIYRGH